uniref:ShKT domain-containing protein n=1 Tax=Rhabditophanes sp. KR3021 TaxID=114890 RepID=A0AC35TV44_9BILA
MPCCLETIGKEACNEMKNKNPELFWQQCQTPDFGIIQCCKSCKTDVSELGSKIFKDGKKSKDCFDRHEKKFCLQLLYRFGWASNEIGCNDDSLPFAFRTCRKTCNYCDIRLYEKNKTSEFCKKWESHYD